MKYISLAVAVAALAVCLLKQDHYDAIRHEFYQVWDSIEEMRADK